MAYLLQRNLEWKTKQQQNNNKSAIGQTRPRSGSASKDGFISDDFLNEIETASNTQADPPVNAIEVLSPAGYRLYGLDAELELKRRKKYELEGGKKIEKRALKWIGKVVGETIDVDDIWGSLKSGVILCKLMNELQPADPIKIDNRIHLPLVERENIQKYLDICASFVENTDLFLQSDLYEKKKFGSGSIKHLCISTPCRTKII